MSPAFTPAFACFCAYIGHDRDEVAERLTRPGSAASSAPNPYDAWAESMLITAVELWRWDRQAPLADEHSAASTFIEEACPDPFLDDPFEGQDPEQTLRAAIRAAAAMRRAHGCGINELTAFVQRRFVLRHTDALAVAEVVVGFVSVAPTDPACSTKN